MTRRAWRHAAIWPVFGVLLAGLAVIGYWLLFTTFQAYDDEGYVLMSLRWFTAGAPLYDAVYTQYGPLPYLLYGALSRLFGFAFTNTSARIVTLVTWTTAAACCGALVHRLTRSSMWTAIATSVTFAYLWPMVNEPIHPGGLAAAILAVGVSATVPLLLSGRRVMFAGVAGAVGAALALTKINVGALFLASAAVYLAVTARGGTRVFFLRVCAWIGALALPLLLVGVSSGGVTEHLPLMIVAACASLSTLIASTAVPERHRADSRTWLALAATAVGGSVAIAIAALACGTSLHALFHGVVIAPLGQPRARTMAVDWAPGAVPLAIASPALALAAVWFRQRSPSLAAICGAAGRLIVLAWMFRAPRAIGPGTLSWLGVGYGVPLAWLFVIPLRDKADGSARLWIAVVLMFQVLHAYPVAGTQVAWGTFLWVPLAIAGAWEASAIVAERLSGQSSVAWRALAAAPVVITAIMLAHMANAGLILRTFEPLRVPGAERVRLPSARARGIHSMLAHIDPASDMLFTQPGTCSVNLWARVPTPTAANATLWFSLLSTDQQQQIIDRLRAARHPEIVINRTLEAEAGTTYKPVGPLYEFIRARFAPIWSGDGYEIWERRN
jgi:hypothetical protein